MTQKEQIMESVQTKSSQTDNSKWVALTADIKQSIIASDKKAEVARKKAEKSGRKFYMMFVPDPNTSYIF